MASDNRGSIVRQGNFLRIDNAFVEEVSLSGRNIGYIVVSYSVPLPNGLTSIELLRLNVNNNTIVLNSFRLPICACDIRRGMWVDATFSPNMTRSIPPQSNAFMIVTRRPMPPSVNPPFFPPPTVTPPSVNPPSSNTTTGRIVQVDAANNLLYTGMPNNLNSQTRFVVTNSTVIQNRNGFPISLRSLRPGQMVRVTHANFMTASIPPQTTAFHIQVL